MKVALILLALLSCSQFRNNPEKLMGHLELYSAPKDDDAVSLSKSERRLVIVTTNDLRGQIEARQETAKDKHSPEQARISIGGAEVFARYLKILREKYPKEVLLLDAGNSLAGSLVSRISSAKAILDFFTKLNYDAITFSDSDLAAGPNLKKSVSPDSWMPELIESTKAPVVVSNLISLKTTQPVDWGGTRPQLLKEVNGVQVGIIGLLADDLPSKLDANALNGYYVEPAIQSFLKQARSLRLKGADVVIVLMHGGLRCGLERAKEKGLPLSKVNFDPMDPTICDTEGSLSQFLNAIPAGSADLVVTGGGPGKIANVINGTPVLQAFGQGSSFARIDLVWSTRDKMLVTNKLRVHQPIRLCHRFFKKTDDCYTEDESIDHRELAPARFLGEDIFPDPKTAAWLEFWREQVVSQLEPLIENPTASHLNKKIYEALMAATAAQVVVTDEAQQILKLPLGTNTWRDLLKSKAAQERLVTVKLNSEQLRLLRDHFSELRWHDRFSQADSTALDEFTLVVPEKIWQKKLQPYAKEQSIPSQGVLSNLIVADSLISWQQDSVGLRASGRSPALPRNQ